MQPHLPKVLLPVLLCVLVSGCSSNEKPSLELASPFATVPASELYQTILQAPALYGLYVGYSGDTPDAVSAFRALVQHDSASYYFNRLLQAKYPPVQAYAVEGLYALNPKKAQRTATRFTKDQRMLPVGLYGCTVSISSMAAFLGQAKPATFFIGSDLRLDNGSLTEYLLTGRVKGADCENGNYPPGTCGS